MATTFDAALPQSHKRPRVRVDASVIMLLLVAALGFYVLYPIVYLLLSSFNVATRPGQPEVWGLQNWITAFSDPAIGKAIANTVALFLAHQLISFPIAILIAWVLARTNIPWSRGFEFMFWLSFFLPSLPITLAWILLLDSRVGLANQAIRALVPFVENGPFDFYSFAGIIWVHLLSHAISSK